MKAPPKILIIGAGASGLAAASQIAERLPVTVLEASARAGGRVHSTEDFSDFPIELGAEEVHGDKCAVMDWVRREGLKVASHLTKDDAIRLDARVQFFDEAGSDPDVRLAFDFIEEVGNFDGVPYTAEQILWQRHFPRRAWHYLDSRLGVEHGTSLDRLGLQGFAHYEKGWQMRETNFTICGRYDSIFTPVLAHPRVDLRLNTPVLGIDWSRDRVRVRTAEDTLEADAVLVTVSVNVLKQGGILFEPELPANKRAALAAMGMDAGMKIQLLFREAFWDPRLYFLHSDGLFPQFWVPGKNKVQRSRVLTAFLGGSRLERLRGIGADPVEYALGELDALFGNGVASRAFEKSLVSDWGADPFVRGLYSYPTMETTEAHRVDLAETLADRLYFAGEATDTHGHGGTVHGAMESGFRAAKAILQDSASLA